MDCPTPGRRRGFFVGMSICNWAGILSWPIPERHQYQLSGCSPHISCENPVTGVTEWNDRAAAVIRDYMTHRDGMRLPESLFTTPLAQAGWAAAYNRSNEAIAVAAGGTEPRYRLWGSYQLNERPADVLGRMLSCCDGRLVPTPDGGLTSISGHGKSQPLF